MEMNTKAHLNSFTAYLNASWRKHPGGPPQTFSQCICCWCWGEEEPSGAEGAGPGTSPHSRGLVHGELDRPPSSLQMSSEGTLGSYLSQVHKPGKLSTAPWAPRAVPVFQRAPLASALLRGNVSEGSAWPCADHARVHRARQRPRAELCL